MTGLDIKVARIKKGIKGIDLAKKLGITPDRMSKIENGHLVADETLLGRIKKVLSN